MGEIRSPSPVLLVIAVSSRYAEAFDWAREHAQERYGPIALASEVFAFTETNYYAATMGADLQKQFLAFERFIDPAELIGIKRETNAWESAYAALDRHPEPRPLNLDPGYMTLAKLVLASTKDHAHRIYLGRGIFAEVTLFFRHGGWQTREWTFPDYQRADYQQFFTACRDWLHDRQREGGPA